MFAKRLGEKLKGHGIRVFSIDPGRISIVTVDFIVPED